MTSSIHPRRLAAVCAATLLALPAGAQSIATSKLPAYGPDTATPGGAPVISADLAPDAYALAGEQRTFTVRATDPDGDRVSLRLLNPPPGAIFRDLHGAASGTPCEVRWTIPVQFSGLQRLIFEAHDDAAPSVRVRHAVTLQVGGGAYGNVGIQLGDVDGDGELDVVAKASRADVAGVANTGALYVWSGRREAGGPPSATLTVPGAAAWSGLGSGMLQLADVTGDGVLDVVAEAPSAEIGGVDGAGAVYVWQGGPALSGSVAPTAELADPNAAEYDSLGFLAGAGTLLSDVTGDGVRDVVTGTVNADVGGVVDTGVLLVFAGGPGLSGTPAPAATLSVTGAAAGDQLGTLYPQALQLTDVTGDGVRDVVCGSTLADAGGVSDAGAMYVWAGGSGLTGPAAPTATLEIGGATAFDQLGALAGGPRLADVSGDGVADVVTGSQFADVAGNPDVGSLYVWMGGAGLAGANAPDAILAASTGDSYHRLGSSEPGVRLADFTGDGVADVLSGTPHADPAEFIDAGALYVWSGGAGLFGTPPPLATLTVPGAAANDALGLSTAGDAVYVCDVTGDRRSDVIAVSGATLGGVPLAGAVYVWSGTSLSGASAPTATLTVPGAKRDDSLGKVWEGQAVQFADVTGNGHRDLVVCAMLEDGVNVDTGAVYVWAGGPALAGALPPSASLRAPVPAAWDMLGWASGQGVLVADLSGDGRLDVVVGAQNATANGVMGSGAAYVWAGGATLLGTPSPLASLANPAAVVFDSMGFASGQGLQVADIEGDGSLDLLIGARMAEVAGVSQVGAMYLWKGGAELAGSPSPSVLSVAGATNNDQLGSLIRIVRWASRSGRAAVLGGALNADVGGVIDTGAIFLWRRPVAEPTGTLAVPGAVAGDSLGH